METMIGFLAELTEWTLDGKRSLMAVHQRRAMEGTPLHLAAGPLAGGIDSICFVAGTFTYYRLAADWCGRVGSAVQR